MRVDASALGISSLIRALLDATEIHDELQESLQAVGVDVDWLAALGDRYRAYWTQTAGYAHPDYPSVVCEHTPMLLSWLLTDLRDPDLSAALSYATDAYVASAIEEVRGKAELPSTERVNLTLGVLGRPVATIDRDFPTYLPGGLVDADVEAAYHGLLMHVSSAGSADWPEMQRTAVLWRLGGIAQGLTGGDDDLVPCMQQLNARLTGVLPPRYRQLTTNEWLTGYRRRRNVLTHVRPIGEVSFTEVIREYEDLSALLDYLRLASIYVAAAISERLAGLDASTVVSWVGIVDDDQSWVDLA